MSPLGWWDFLSIQFPCDFRQWISRGRALKGDAGSWLKGPLGKSVQELGRINYNKKTNKRKWSSISGGWREMITNKRRIVLHLPPSLSSAEAWALSWSFRTKHWYIPLSSRRTCSILNTVSVWLSATPSFIQLMDLMGFPSGLQVNVAGRP